MKKSLLALAVLGAFAGVASAQSSVTLSGTVDVSGKYVKNDGAERRVSLDNNGINTSQLVFAGREDLGGGLYAGFELNSAIFADTGTVDSNRFFTRRAVAKLGGNFGEIRLGRDYTPTFWNLTSFDAFGTNGVGSSLNPDQLFAGTRVRADNSIGYFLPKGLGGVYGQVMVAAAENSAPGVPAVVGAAAGNPGRYLGARVGFAAGPFDIAGSYGVQRFVTGAEDMKTFNVGGSYDLGFLKLMGYFNRDKQGSEKDRMISVSAVVPFGQSEIHVGYDNDKRDGAFDSKVDQIKLGYVYNLSKRTAFYGTVSRLANKDGTSLAIGGGFPIDAGGNSKAAEVGLRHFF
jgi:predicted porin